MCTSMTASFYFFTATASSSTSILQSALRRFSYTGTYTNFLYIRLQIFSSTEFLTYSKLIVILLHIVANDGAICRTTESKTLLMQFLLQVRFFVRHHKCHQQNTSILKPLEHNVPLARATTRTTAPRENTLMHSLVEWPRHPDYAIPSWRDALLPNKYEHQILIPLCKTTYTKKKRHLP